MTQSFQEMQKFKVLEGNLSDKKYLQNICKTKYVKNQANVKHSSNSEDIFKSTKNVLENLNTEEDSSSNTTTSKKLSKICDRKNLQSNNTTFPWVNFL